MYEDATYQFTAGDGSAIHDPVVVASLQNMSVLTYVKLGNNNFTLLPYRMFNSTDNPAYLHAFNDNLFIYLRTEDVDGAYFPWDSQTQFKFRFVYIPFSAIQDEVDIHKYPEVEAAYLNKVNKL